MSILGFDFVSLLFRFPCFNKGQRSGTMFLLSIWFTQDNSASARLEAYVPVLIAVVDDGKRCMNMWFRCDDRVHDNVRLEDCNLQLG
jgi:hypothetical protein